MNKTNLFVIDLDNTLLKIDSLKWLIFKSINLKLFIFISLRAIGYFNKREFSEYIYKELYRNAFTESNKKNFIKFLNNKIDDRVISHIEKYKTGDDTVIIISASPDFYVKKIANKLGFSGFGSYIKEGVFYHLKATNKLNFIKTHYPESKYNYFYTISDSLTDKPLLKIFKYSFLKNNNKIHFYE